MTVTGTPLPQAPHGVSETAGAYNDWPNDIGFEVFHEELTPIELKVSGKIPAYAAGVLYRTGPGGHQTKTAKGNEIFTIDHWFDGFAQNHRFELVAPSAGEHSITRILYNSRHSCNKSLEKIRKTGEIEAICFGQKHDPCSSLFRKVMSSFHAAVAGNPSAVDGVNIGVTLERNMPGLESGDVKRTAHLEKEGHVSGKDNLWVKTDNSRFQEIDPVTLEPVGIASQQTLHPDLKGPMAGAHSRTDPISGDVFNYNLELGAKATYRVFQVSKSTGHTSILATISGPGVKAAYLHSFMLTENYVILCIYNAYHVKGGVKMLWTKNMLEALEFEPGVPNKWFVIDRRHGKGVVGVYESDPFFAFHCVNAWEEEKPSSEAPTIDIIADIPIYQNLDILKRFYYENMKSSAPGARAFVGEHTARARTTLTRFKLTGIDSHQTLLPSSPAKAVDIVFKGGSDSALELPTFNPRYALKPSRYIYGASDSGRSTFFDGLAKYDTLTRTAALLSVHAHSPGEAIFLADPAGVDEDDGVLLSVVLDGIQGKSYLLVVDAKTFTEIGRAEMDCVVPFGFHGIHVPGGS